MIIMLLKEKIHPSNQTSDTSYQTCLSDNTTIICGTIIELDYISTIEDKMITEQYYGDIDLFGF